MSRNSLPRRNGFADLSARQASTAVPTRHHMTADDAVDFIIDHFEGTTFVDHPDDRGGPTKFGITKKSLSRTRGRAVTTNDIHELTRAEAKTIYEADYVTPVRGDDMSYGPLRLAAIDYAIHSGPRTAVKAMQEIVGVTTDGIIGPITWNAITHYNERGLFVRLMSHRLTFLTRIVSRDTSQVSFVYGWGKRLAKILDVAA